MPASEARIRANQQNSLRSTGPKTPEGKERSRRNGLKHGLTGAGVVLFEDDSAEIELRNEELQAELAPKSGIGKIMVLKMATMSVRMERSARQESAAIAARVRHAAESFDEERFEQAERLFEALGDDPRGNLRKLRRMPEGVDRLVVAWGDLRANLAQSSRPTWTAEHHQMVANLAGRRVADAGATRLEVLSEAIRGDFTALADHEGGDLDDDARRGWARDRMVERVDAEVAALEIHRDSLDLEMIELDRLDAPDRALFDPSKEASLARRYESEARRGFFKALKEFRQAEAEFAGAEIAARPEPAPPRRPEPSRPVPTSAPLASPWEAPDPRPGESFAAYRERALLLDEAAQKADRRPLAVDRVE